MDDIDINELRESVAKNQIQPQGYSSFITWYCIFYISKISKVVNSGDGGDEVFGGYKWYKKLTQKERYLD